MLEAQEDEYQRLTTSIDPAVIYIQELVSGRVTEEPRRRRITLLLDYPAVKQFGRFSWLLVIVAVAATRPVAAIPIGILVLAGLLVGIINAMRWLFARKR